MITLFVGKTQQGKDEKRGLCLPILEGLKSVHNGCENLFLEDYISERVFPFAFRALDFAVFWCHNATQSGRMAHAQGNGVPNPERNATILEEGILGQRKRTTTEEIRPWGGFLVLEDAPTHKVKRIWVHPRNRLSYQKHFRRCEHWFVLEGRARVTLDGREISLGGGESIDIPVEAAHRIENIGDKRLTFIEVQRGDYFGEDDIVRLEDDYGRVP